MYFHGVERDGGRDGVGQRQLVHQMGRSVGAREPARRRQCVIEQRGRLTTGGWWRGGDRWRCRTGADREPAYQDNGAKRGQRRPGVHVTSRLRARPRTSAQAAIDLGSCLKSVAPRSPRSAVSADSVCAGGQPPRTTALKQFVELADSTVEWITALENVCTARCHRDEFG